MPLHPMAGKCELKYFPIFKILNTKEPKKENLMASILNEYLSKRLGLLDLQNELQQLIKRYNSHTGRYMFVYVADINKGRISGVDVSMVQGDFYNIHDMLRESPQKKIDFYIETPGGSGEAAE